MMKRRVVQRATKAELECIKDIERHPPLELLAAGRARILSPAEYPEPVRRFLARERAKKRRH